MANNSIEFQVSLGLQGAQNQVKALHEALEQSVKVDSSAFKEIEKFLNKITTVADGLKGKMGDAFKTSNSSKAFLRQYESLLNMIETAKQKFGHLGVKDIQFSTADTKTIDHAINRIKTLESEIANLEKGKIGNIFNNDSIQGADKVRAIISQLNLDMNNLTFSQLSQTVSKELNSVNDSVSKVEKQINSLNSQINALNGNKLSDVVNQIHMAVEGATDKRTFQASNTTYGDILDRFYSSFSEYKGGKRGEIKSGGSVSDFINKESDNIKNGIAAMEKEVERYQKALERIAELRNQTLKDSGMTAEQKKSEALNIAKELGINEDVLKSIDTSKAYTTVIPQIRKAIEEQMKSEGIMSPDAIEALQKNMLESLQHVFDDTQLDRTINVNRLQQSLKTIFSNLNFDLKDTNIASIIQMPTKNLDMDSFLSLAQEGLRKYSESLEATRDSSNTNLEEMKAKANEFAAVLATIGKGGSARDDSIAKARQEIEQYRDVIAQLVQQYNAKFGMNLRLEEDGKQALTAKGYLEQYIQSVSKLESKQKALSNVQSAVTRWMGFYQVLNLTRRAIQSMKQHITELDTVMTKIAVVTNMSQNDLWNQIGQYSEIARQYGVAIKGVYEVSQIYYQQGLNKGDVMGLTTETLKMARIAGLDYATAADYMTTAIRGFKLEMADAAHVTDVFSNLAAHTASSTEELATAISKTAASAASVGSSFESTSAMMATMIATTRESATNIGTALKSIISRYGEMKANPEGKDEEGEDYSLNKVDTALQSIGISIHDVNGQFRDFDDVVLELAEAWDGIDKNTQRYIATVMAGNRQQSRFLSLVSNVEEYKRALELANDSEGAGELQTLKTLDSIDAKIERMKVTIQEFYTSSGIQDLYKGILDTITNVISGANALPKAFGNFPALALTLGLQIINIVKNVAKLAIASIAAHIDTLKNNTTSVLQGIVQKMREAGDEGGQAMTEAANNRLKNIGKDVGTNLKSMLGQRAGALLSLFGSTLSIAATSAYGASKTPDQDRVAAGQMLGASLLTGIGSGISTGFAIGGPYGAIAGAITGIASALPTLISAINMNRVTLAREIELAKKEQTEKTEQATIAKGKLSELQQAYDKLSALASKAYESSDAMEEYHEYMNQLADSYPYLISSMETSGNKIIQVSDLEKELANVRSQSARAIVEQLNAEKQTATLTEQAYKEFASGLDKIYTGSSKDFDISDLAENIRNALPNAVERWTTNHNIRDIIDPYELVIKAYDKIYGNNTDPNRNNGFVKLSGINTTKNGYGLNNWKQIFNENSEMILRWAEGFKIPETNISRVEMTVRENLRDSLKKLEEEATSAGLDNFSLSDVTGIENLKNLDDLLDSESYTYDEVIAAVKRAKKWASDELGRLGVSIDAITKTTFDVEIEESVLQDAELPKKEELKKFTSLFTSLKEFIGFNLNEGALSEANQNIKLWLEDWILENIEVAEDILNLNLNNISFGDINVFSKLLNLDIEDEDDKKILDALTKKYIQDTKKIRTDFNEALEKSIFKDDKENIDFFKELVNGDNETDLPPSLFNTLQSQLNEYKKIKNAGYDIAAKNYLEGLKNIYMAIGELEDPQIEQILPIIRNVDLTDADAVKEVIDALEEIPWVPQNIKDALNFMYKQASTNIVTQAMQLSEKTQKVAETVNKALNNIGKGMEFDEVFKTATEIYNNLSKDQKKKYKLDNFYRFDNELQKWILTEDAIKSQIESASGEYAEVAKTLNQEAENQLSLLEQVYGNFMMLKGISWMPQGVIDFAKAVTDFNVDNVLLQAGITDPAEIAKYKNKFEEWRVKFEQAEDPTQVLSEIQDEIEQIKEQDLRLAESLLKNSVISFLASTDWASIAGGTANEENTKSRLKLLLENAGIQNAEETVNSIWDNMLSGNVEEVNKLLEGTGYQINKNTEKEIKSSQVKQYLTAIDEIQNITDPANWSESTTSLITELKDESGELILTEDMSPAQKVAKLYELLEGQIDGINYTLEQYNNDLAELNTKNTDIEKIKNTIDLLTNGFNLTEFASYLNTNFSIFEDKKFNNFFKDGQFVTDKEKYRGLFEVDENGQWYVAAERNIQDVIDFFQEELGISLDVTSANWKNYLTSEVDRAIADANKADQGQKVASTINSLASAKLGDRINVEGLPAEVLALMGAEASRIAEISSEFERDSWILAINANQFTQPEAKAAIVSAQEAIRAKRAKGTALQNIISKSISRDAAKTYLTSRKYILDGASSTDIDNIMRSQGYIWNEYTQQYTATTLALATINQDIKDAVASGASQDIIDNLRTAAKELERELNQDPAKDALIELLNNYTNLTPEILDQFKVQFESKGIDIEKYIVTDVFGQSRLIDVKGLQNALLEAGLSYNEIFESYFETFADEYINNLSNAMNLVSQGTTNQTDIKTWLTKFLDLNMIEGTDISLAFDYNNLLSAWTLKPEVLIKYAKTQANQLKLSGEQAQQFISDQTTKPLAQAVDIGSYLAAENWDWKGLATTQLRTQLKNWATAHWFGVTPDENTLRSFISIIQQGGQEAVDLALQVASDAGKELTAEEISSIYSPVVTRLNTFAEKLKTLQIGDYVAEGEFRQILSQVGAIDQDGLVQSVEAMVDAYAAIYDSMVGQAGATASQLNNIYAQYLTAQEQTDIDAVNLMQNAMGMDYVSLGELLGRYGINMRTWMSENVDIYTKIGAGKLRINNPVEMLNRLGISPDSEEYTSALKAANDSLIEFNTQAKTKIQNEIQALSEAKPGDQINLTELWTELNKSIEKQYGNLLSENIEDYSDNGIMTQESAILLEEARKNNLKIKQKIQEEQSNIYQRLDDAGATFKDGILTLEEDAKLPEVIRTILSITNEKELILSEEIAKLGDVLIQFLENINNLIATGIDGALSRTEASELSQFAENYGVNLDFTKTTEGFKLTQASAISLYNVMKSIDALSSKVTFDKLRESLKETNENYATITGLLNHIVDLQNILSDKESNVPTARREEYEAELALAQQIAAVRSTEQDDTFNFMSNDIPAAQNNPLNYAKNWTDALHKIRDAWDVDKVSKNGQTGFMDYKDFYNIVTELNNMAALGQDIELAGITLDGSLEACAALIQKGAEALTTVDSGDLMVNLQGIGLSLANGGSSLEAGITDGVHSIAEAQVSALDGLIAMLELIVAMEQLGDITGEDTSIDLGDIFAVNGKPAAMENIADINEFTKEFEISRENLFKYLNEVGHEDAQAAFKNASIKIGDEWKSMYDMMDPNKTFQDLFGGLEGEVKEQAITGFQSLLDAFYQAAISGNYDTDNIAGSLQEILNSNGFGDIANGFMINLGDTTYTVQNGIVIEAADWTTDAAKEAVNNYIAKYGGDQKQARQKITEALQAYLAGEGAGEVGLETVISVHHSTVIKEDKDGKYILGADGKTKYRAGDDGWKSALAEIALKDQANIPSTAKITQVGTGAETTVEYGNTNKVNFKVSADQSGKITWQAVDESGTLIGQPGNTQEQALKQLYLEQINAENRANGQKDITLSDIKQEDYNIWLYDSYGVHAVIKPQVTKEGVTVEDPSKDPEIRAALQHALTDTPIQAENLTAVAGGYVDVELPGTNIKVRLNAEDIALEVDGEGKVKKFDTSLLAEQIESMAGIDVNLSKTISAGIAGAFGENGIPLDNLKIVPQSTIVDGEVEVEPIEKATGTVTTLELNALSTIGKGATDNINITLSEMPDLTVDANTEAAIAKINELKNAAKEVTSNITLGSNALEGSIEANRIAAARTPAAQSITVQSNAVPGEIDRNVSYASSHPAQQSITTGGGGDSPATGNIGLAIGNAFARGTLMGELGPELVVSQGRYFVVGQSGPEMVNLADDAIVFNHIQTKSLLTRGTSSTRGRAITNDYTAASYAKGNVNGGPAMASASAALAALKQLRAQWQSLMNLTAQDLAGKAGGGGGGGGGGSDPKAFIKELEKWYDWMQQIAQLEKEITLEEAKRTEYQSNMIAKGREYYASQIKTLDALQEQMTVQRSLNDSQQEYFNKRRQELNTQSAFSALYGFGESGQLYYQKDRTFRDGMTAFEWLSDLAGRNAVTGEANYTAAQQYQKLVAAGFGFAMEYDSEGNPIDKEQDNWENTAVQAFWDKIEADKEEMQSLHDALEDGQKALLDAANQQNEILKEIQDNQIAVEDKVLKAIEDIRQQEIDNLKDEKDAIDKSSKALIDGLSEQLDKEQKMYQRQQESGELTKLQRQLSILQRSGGSAAQIASLQKDISAKQQEAYFEAQQDQIDALQEASDNQLEKLQKQIDLMTESLAFEKEHGLLWQKVYEVMQRSPEEITQFIMDNTKEYWGESPTKLAQDTRDVLFEAQQFTEFRDSVEGGIDALLEYYGIERKKEPEQKEEEIASTTTSTASTTTTKPQGKQMPEEVEKFRKRAIRDATAAGEKLAADQFKKNQQAIEDAKKATEKPFEVETYDAQGKKQVNRFKTQGAADAYVNAAAGTGYTVISDSAKQQDGNGLTDTIIRKYSKGGMVDKDQLAFVHAKESVLTAEQTSTLRNEILSNKPSSALSVLTSLRDMWTSAQNTSTISHTNDSTIVIEHASVEMNVQRMANDYDAQRAGEQALDKIVQIARRTQAQNRIGG